MNTSMTINATAPWLLALYIVAAERQGAARAKLAGTVQNDLIKEYLSRGTYIFPPRPSLKLTADVIAFTYREMPKLEPGQRLLLSPAGGGRDAGAGARLRARRRDRDARHGAGPAARSPAGATCPRVVGRISFFVNAGAALRHRDVQAARLRASCGTRSRASATASPTRSSAASATASRSTRWA